MNKEQKILIAGVLLVAAAVFAVHWPALSSEAISFDDEQYLLENELVKNPSFASAKRFLGEVLRPSTVRGYYQPLAMISLMLDCALGASEENLLPFRLTSLALHTANTCLVVVLFYLLFNSPIVAVMVGLLFGLHPLTIESIPWLSERKTLLAMFFALLALISYVRFARTKNKLPFCGCFVFFLLALMSKPTTVPLPLLFVLLDYWPLNRLSKKAILEKIPFLVLAGIAAIIIFLSQRNTAGVIMPTEFGPMHIPLVICHNVIFYLHKFLWPIDLSAFYPFPSPLTAGQPMVLAGLIGTPLLIAGLIISLRWTRSVLVGWLFFFLAIFPTLGVIGFHPVIAADRHVYLPMLGFFLPAALLLKRFTAGAGEKIFNRRNIFAVSAVVILCASQVTLSRLYHRSWRDTVTHYSSMLSLTPDEHIIHNNLAIAFKKLGDPYQAITHYEKSLQLKNDAHEIHNNIGNALLEIGQAGRAIVHYRKAVALTENMTMYHNTVAGFAEGHYNLANALKRQGRFAEAVEHFKKSLAIKASNIDGLNGLGESLGELKEHQQAIVYFDRAIQLDSNNIIAHGRRGMALAAMGQTDGAIDEFKFVLKAVPDDADMYCNLGILLMQKGKTEQAAAALRKAIELEPENVRAKGLLNKIRLTGQ